jgi:glucose/arabinose dehydrogenase
VLLAEAEAGKITLLRDANGDGTAEVKTTFADGFQRPHGMAFANGKFYVADALGIYSFPYKDGDTKVSGPRTPVTENGAFGKLGGHWTRNLAVNTKGELFVAVGSNGNINDKDDPWRAAVSKVVGNKLVQYGTGLRNPVGITFYPGTDDLYVVVNERDGEGDELVPDYLTRVQQGDFYGWPYAYLGQHEEPSLKGKRPDLVAKAKVPDVLFRSHSAPLGLLFYTGTQFPAQYRGGAFVAHHGSWNASNPRGYKIVYVPFQNGRPWADTTISRSDSGRRAMRLPASWAAPSGSPRRKTAACSSPMTSATRSGGFPTAPASTSTKKGGARARVRARVPL